MDSSSLSELELGTKAHPYKAFQIPFFEIFNEFSVQENPDSIITVLIREGTTYTMLRGGVLVNKQNIQIK